MAFTPREYQITAVDKVVESARKGHRAVILQSPTGSGKTTMACMLARRVVGKGKNITVIANRRRLIEQFSERAREFEIDHGIVMAGHGYQTDCYMQIASKDTLLSRAVNNEFIGMPPADVLVIDECRHALAPAFRKMVEYYISRGAYIIGLDATPSLPDGSGLSPLFTDMVQAAKMSYLIDNKFLLPLKAFCPERKHLKHKKKRGIMGSLVESWKNHAQGLPTVLFTSRVKHSKDAVATFLEEGIRAAHVDADTSDEERSRIFDGLETGEYQVVSNCSLISEGVDIPCLGCVQFYCDVNSRNSFIQRCGRIMRPYKGQEVAIIIDHAGIVYRFGFPDEDMEWPIDGNSEELFKKQQKEGLTAQAKYCGYCELMYKNSIQCPQCGREPVKPPKSIFQPDPVDVSNALLIEAERSGKNPAEVERQMKIQHWVICLRTAKKKNSTPGMAAQIYRRKYNCMPDRDFPYMPKYGQWKTKVSELFPRM